MNKNYSYALLFTLSIVASSYAMEFDKVSFSPMLPMQIAQSGTMEKHFYFLSDLSKLIIASFGANSNSAHDFFITIDIRPGNTEDKKNTLVVKSTKDYFPSYVIKKEIKDEVVLVMPQEQVACDDATKKDRLKVIFYVHALPKIRIWGNVLLTMSCQKWKEKTFSLRSLKAFEKSHAHLTNVINILDKKLSLGADDHSKILCEGNANQNLSIVIRDHSNVEAQNLKTPHISIFAFKSSQGKVLAQNATLNASAKDDSNIIYYGKPSTLTIAQENNSKVKKYKNLGENNPEVSHD